VVQTPTSLYSLPPAPRIGGSVVSVGSTGRLTGVTSTPVDTASEKPPSTERARSTGRLIAPVTNQGRHWRDAAVGPSTLRGVTETERNVRAWSQAYRDDGLVVISVHAPEFSSSAAPDGVRKASSGIAEGSLSEARRLGPARSRERAVPRST
jgi:hypothetical protein